jgi:dynein heavy chain 1
VYVYITDILHYYLFAAPIGKALYKLLVIQAFRADRLMAMASIFVATVLGETFVHSAEQELNLAEIVANEVQSCLDCWVQL